MRTVHRFAAGTRWNSPTMSTTPHDATAERPDPGVLPPDDPTREPVPTPGEGTPPEVPATPAPGADPGIPPPFPPPGEADTPTPYPPEQPA